MTFSDAIKCIDDVLSSDYHYDESLGYQLTSDDIEWLEMAKAALKKQIPTNPVFKKIGVQIIKGDKPVDIELAYCPFCDNAVDSFEHHCECCGQALKWKEQGQ